MLGYTLQCLIKMNNGFKNSAVTFTKKPSLTLKINFKTRSIIIYEGSNFIDSKAEYCCSQGISWFFNEFSCSCETSKMFEALTKYPGVYQVFDHFWCTLTGNKYSHGYLVKLSCLHKIMHKAQNDSVIKPLLFPFNK